MTLQLEEETKFRPTFAGGLCSAEREIFQRDIGICALCKTDTMALSAALWEVQEHCSDPTFRYLKAWLGLAVSRFPQPLWQGDHVVPLSRGGLSVLANMRTLCLVCHRRANDLLREGKLI